MTNKRENYLHFLKLHYTILCHFNQIESIASNVFLICIECILQVVQKYSTQQKMDWATAILKQYTKMYYKLSALELELLAKDRNKILKQFRKHQVSKYLGNIHFLIRYVQTRIFQVYINIYQKASYANKKNRKPYV